MKFKVSDPLREIDLKLEEGLHYVIEHGTYDEKVSILLAIANVTTDILKRLLKGISDATVPTDTE